ncbi:MAG: hypothetical protein A2096_08335 [Spirochaetes bacterium GWF1_41_5]|nr:MAG: hypothetical protein A2096_08335 [Spirochaetes bacterium GWF1_41_5]HBE02881.1 FMN-binding protein [Spirochaetia bacterium]
MKKILIILLIVAALALSAFLLFRNNYQKMRNAINTEFSKVQAVNLAGKPDGNYTGEFGSFLVNVKLEVTVSNNSISGIKILKQDCGKGYEALATTDRIITANSPLVDAVTGATSSSKSIMIAVWKALQ